MRERWNVPPRLTSTCFSPFQEPITMRPLNLVSGDHIIQGGWIATQFERQVGAGIEVTRSANNLMAVKRQVYRDGGLD